MGLTSSLFNKTERKPNLEASRCNSPELVCLNRWLVVMGWPVLLNSIHLPGMRCATPAPLIIDHLWIIQRLASVVGSTHTRPHLASRMAILVNTQCYWIHWCVYSSSILMNMRISELQWWSLVLEVVLTLVLLAIKSCSCSSCHISGLHCHTWLVTFNTIE